MNLFCVYFLDMWCVCSEGKTCITLYGGVFSAHTCGLGRLVISLLVYMCASALWVVCVYILVCLISVPKGLNGLRQELRCRDNLLRC